MFCQNRSVFWLAVCVCLCLCFISKYGLQIRRTGPDLRLSKPQIRRCLYRETCVQGSFCWVMVYPVCVCVCFVLTFVQHFVPCMEKWSTHSDDYYYMHVSQQLTLTHTRVHHDCAYLVTIGTAYFHIMSMFALVRIFLLCFYFLFLECSCLFQHCLACIVTVQVLV